MADQQQPPAMEPPAPPAAGGYPANDPRGNAFYALREQTPPWIQAGYPDFDSWSRARTDTQGKGQIVTIGGNVVLIDPTTGTILQNYGPSGSGASAGAITPQSAATLAEQQRQYNETFGYNKAVYNTNVQLDQAKQAWQQAIDARDFTAAEHWKQVTTGLQAQQFAETQRVNSANIANQQNRLALDYTQMLANKSGPQDWVKYWYLSRGKTPPLGSESVPLAQALPAWAQPAGAQAAAAPAQATAAAPSWAAPMPVNPASSASVRTASAAVPAWAGSADPFASTRPGGLAAPPLPAAAVVAQSERAQAAQQPGVLSLSGSAMAPGVTYAAPVTMPQSTSQSPNVVTGFRNEGGDVVTTGMEQYQRPDVAPGVAGGKFWQSYDQGGVVREPVTGRGAWSGRPYGFAMNGRPEMVMPMWVKGVRQ